MAGGATLPRALSLYESDQTESPFGLYWEREVAVALAAGYAKIAFSMLSWCPLLELIGLLLYLYSSTSTGHDDDLVALEVA